MPSREPEISSDAIRRAEGIWRTNLTLLALVPWLGICCGVVLINTLLHPDEAEAGVALVLGAVVGAAMCSSGLRVLWLRRRGYRQPTAWFRMTSIIRAEEQRDAEPSPAWDYYFPPESASRSARARSTACALETIRPRLSVVWIDVIGPDECPSEIATALDRALAIGDVGRRSGRREPRDVGLDPRSDVELDLICALAPWTPGLLAYEEYEVGAVRDAGRAGWFQMTRTELDRAIHCAGDGAFVVVSQRA